METMTSRTLNYTHAACDINSSVIKNVFYNQNSQELLVVLNNDYAYCYSLVPKWRFDDLVNAPSPGSYYNRVIKPTHGPFTWQEDGENVTVLKVSEVPLELKNVTRFRDAIAQVTNVGDADRFSEGATDDTTTHEYEVFFTVNKGDEKSYTLPAASVEAAVESLQEVAEMLDVDVNVTKVTVYFE